jgi:predicted amidohydrolase YtcJ
LDPVSPNNPVLIEDFSGHGMLANSKALGLAGIDRDTPSPTGGIVVKDPFTGEPTGHLREAPAIDLLTKVVPPFTRSQKREAIQSSLTELTKLGITSITDAALGPGGSDHMGGVMGSECLSIYNDLYNEGRLTARVTVLYLFGQYGTCSAKNLEEIVPKIGIHTWFGNDWLRIGGIKIFADGVPTTGTAWMHEEYVGGGTGSLVLPGSTDEERYDELIKMILFCHKNGFQVGVHVVGDRGIEACIDGFVKAEKEEPRGLRHYIIHGDFVRDSDIRRAAQYDIGFSTQPSIKWTIADFMIGMVGEKRAARQWPLRALIDAGVHVTGSSDAPVTYPSWQMGIQSAILRESKATGQVSGPEQCITREEAIRMYTIEGARQDHMESIKGSIEVGKLADLCILDNDIMTVDAHSIKDIRSLATIVGGQVVYDAGLAMSSRT